MRLSSFSKQTEKINKVVMYLTLSDMFSWGFMLTVNGFVGLYLATKLQMDVVSVVGVGAGIYSLAKGAVQIPFGTVIDKTLEDKDDIWFLFIGSVLMGAPFLLYPIINTAIFYYVLQFIIGVGAGINVVSWRKLFAKNVDKGKEGLEYGAYETIMSISIAIFSLVAGYLANINQQYFDAVMVGIGFLIMSGGFWVIRIFSVKFRK